MPIDRVWCATIVLVGSLMLLGGGCGSARKACVCPTIYAPVCGADGHTYGNSCEADCLGVRVAHQGECTTDGGSGGTAGSGSGGRGGGSACRPAAGCCVGDSDCPTAQSCVGATCAAGDPTSGVCKPRPSVAGQCWGDAHCTTPNRCVNPRVCPCGAACLVADEPGTCAP